MNNPRLNSPSVNLVRFGADRDRRILNAVESLVALSTDQIAALFFPCPSSIRRAQHRTAILVKEKRLPPPLRLSQDAPSIFFSKRVARVEHLIDTNWVFVWLSNRLQGGQNVFYWQGDISLGICRPDALTAIQSKFAGEIWWYFVEMEHANNHGEFDKVRKYNQLFEEQLDRMGGYWWYEHMNRFPKLLFVVEDKATEERILRHIKKENTNNLRWEIKYLQSIKREAAPWANY